MHTISQCMQSTIVVENITYQPGKSGRTHDLTELWEWRSLRFPQTPHSFPAYQRGTLTVNLVIPISISSSDSIPASRLRITRISDLFWLMPDDRDTPDGKMWGRDTKCPFTCGVKQWVRTTIGKKKKLFTARFSLLPSKPSLCHPVWQMMIHAGRFETRWQAWKSCHHMVHGKRSRWTTAHLSRHRGTWGGKITEGPRSAADCRVWRLGGCPWAHKLQVCHDSPKSRS